MARIAQVNQNTKTIGLLALSAVLIAVILLGGSHRRQGQYQP
jgi:hypothetical protein